MIRKRVEEIKNNFIEYYFIYYLLLSLMLAVLFSMYVNFICMLYAREGLNFEINHILFYTEATF